MARKRASNGDEMRRFWDAKARENAMFYIHSQVNYADVDEAEFWASGPENLNRTLEPFALQIDRRDRVVEIGCGIGRMTRALAERAERVIGLDVSTEMVERARKTLSDLANVEILLGNGHDLSAIPDGSADVVYSFIVFQHIPDPAITYGYIREIGRVLRPGGWSVFQVSERPELHRRGTWRKETTTLRSRLRRALGRAPRNLGAPQWLGSALRPDELEQAVAGAGMTIEGIVGEGTQFCLVYTRRPG